MLFKDTKDVVLLDGAMGTMLQKHGLKAGERPDIMNMTAPDAVEAIHRMYIEAGSRVICTNTFGANDIALRGTGYTPEEIISAAVAIAKRAGAGAVALDIGPTGEFFEPYGSMTFDEAYNIFKRQATAGERAGADIAIIETMSAPQEMRAAILAVKENTGLPVFATMTFDKNGRTFTGCKPEEFSALAEELGVAAAGVNCSLSPDEIYPIVEKIAEACSLPLIVKPNAGLPNSKTGLYDLSATDFAGQMARYKALGVKYAGGCCGTSPDYIRELARVF